MAVLDDGRVCADDRFLALLHLPPRISAGPGKQGRFLMAEKKLGFYNGIIYKRCSTTRTLLQFISRK